MRSFRQVEEALAIWCNAIIEANLTLSDHLLRRLCLELTLMNSKARMDE